MSFLQQLHIYEDGLTCKNNQDSQCFKRIVAAKSWLWFAFRLWLQLPCWQAYFLKAIGVNTIMLNFHSEQRGCICRYLIYLKLFWIKIYFLGILKMESYLIFFPTRQFKTFIPWMRESLDLDFCSMIYGFAYKNRIANIIFAFCTIYFHVFYNYYWILYLLIFLYVN